MKDQHLESSIFGDAADGGGSSADAPDPLGGLAGRPGDEALTGEDGTARPGRSGGPGRHPRGAGGPGGPLTPQERRRRRRRRRTRGLLVLLVCVALVGGAGVVAVQVLKPMVAGLTESKDWTGTGTGRATVVVHAGDSGRTIGVALQQAGVVKTSKAFADVAAG